MQVEMFSSSSVMQKSAKKTVGYDFVHNTFVFYIFFITKNVSYE